METVASYPPVPFTVVQSALGLYNDCDMLFFSLIGYVKRYNELWLLGVLKAGKFVLEVLPAAGNTAVVSRGVRF